MRTPPPCSLAAFPQRASPENQITQGKPLPAGMAAAIFPRSPAAGCSTVASADAERPTQQRVPRVGHKISVRKRTVLLWSPPRMRCAANHYRSLASGTSARMLPFCLVRSCNVHRGVRTGSPRSRYAHQSKRSQHCEHLTIDPLFTMRVSHPRPFCQKSIRAMLPGHVTASESLDHWSA